MLKPERMARIRIIGTNQKRSTIIQDLHDLGVMQIESVNSDVEKLFPNQYNSENYKLLSDYLSEFKGYLSMLNVKEVKHKTYFESEKELFDAISKINIKDSLLHIKETDESLLSAIKENENYVKIFNILKNFRGDISILNNSYVKSYIIEKSEEINRLKNDYTDIISLDDNYSLVTINRKYEAEFLSALSGISTRIIHIPEFNGMPLDLLKEAQRKIKDATEQRKVALNELNNISGENYEEIIQIEEQLEIAFKEAEITTQLASSENVFAMEGWIPEKELENARKILEKDSDNEVILQVLKTKEDPPTKLSNPKHFKIFEFFIRFYSLPQEYEFDPTLIFALIFPVFFGIMVGDAGYGLVILLFSLFIIHRIDHPPKVSHIPKKISGFVLMILGKNALKNLSKALIPASIISIFFGIIFNEFFGFTIYPVPFRVATTPIPVMYLGKLLLISGYTGLGLVTFGFILGIINNIYINHKKAAVAKAGWIMMAWALAILGLNLIHKISLSPTNISSLIGFVLFVSGFVLVISFEGVQSLMEIPSIISHILSYTRIVGILLASVVLALVINTVFKSTLSAPFYIIIFGIVILIFGQLFNLVIAVFEPGIQGARLLYVEFFSKFYFGNGKPFSPFGTRRLYTLKKFDVNKNEINPNKKT